MHMCACACARGQLGLARARAGVRARARGRSSGGGVGVRVLAGVLACVHAFQFDFVGLVQRRGQLVLYGEVN